MSQQATTVISKSDKPDCRQLPTYVDVANSNGTAPIVLVCEHASNIFPDKFTSPLDNKQLINEHIAWDPGAKALAQELSLLLNAPLVYSNVSRLIYDCNRPPESDSAIPIKSELHEIPGNRNLNEAERQLRIDEIYRPFHSTLANVIADKQLEGINPALVTVHSFTPEYFNQVRKTEIGILHDRDSSMADLMLSVASQVCRLLVERNKPYGPEHGVTHTLVKHGITHSLPNVMLEIKNDLLTTTLEIKTMADIIHKMLAHSLPKLALSA